MKGLNNKGILNVSGGLAFIAVPVAVKYFSAGAAFGASTFFAAYKLV